MKKLHGIKNPRFSIVVALENSIKDNFGVFSSAQQKVVSQSLSSLLLVRIAWNISGELYKNKKLFSSYRISD